MIGFLPRHDLSSLMKTSHECYELCLRQLFRGPIELRADNIMSFHLCLRLGSSPSRPHFLRHVIVTCSLSVPTHPSGRKGDVPSIEHLLCDILQDACHLKRLQLDWGAASSSSYLRYASARATALEELTAPFVSQALCDTITSLSAPLRRLAMKFGPMNQFPATNPVVLLEPFSSTLEDLDLAVVQCEDGPVQYPLVTRLALSDCYYGMSRGGVDIGPVARAFPHVLELSLSAAKVSPDVSHWLIGRCCDHADVIERCRRVNQQHWKEGADMWHSLTRVTVGHIVDLYMLGLCHAVRHVDIDALSEGTLWMVPHVLSDTHPSSLAITLFPRDHILDALAHLFPPGDGTASLTHLSLVLRCDVPKISVDKLTVSPTLAILLPYAVLTYCRVIDARHNTSHTSLCRASIHCHVKMGHSRPIPTTAGRAERDRHHAREHTC